MVGLRRGRGGCGDEIYILLYWNRGHKLVNFWTLNDDFPLRKKKFKFFGYKNEFGSTNFFFHFEWRQNLKKVNQALKRGIIIYHGLIFFFFLGSSAKKIRVPLAESFQSRRRRWLMRFGYYPKSSILKSRGNLGANYRKQSAAFIRELVSFFFFVFFLLFAAFFRWNDFF